MAYSDFMKKVRYWDNLTAKWILRHFYLMFFQIILVLVFVGWFINTLHVIDISFESNKHDILERLLLTQSINTTIIVLLTILNSFWLLYLFSGIQRLRSILKDISYNTSKIHQLKPRPNPPPGKNF